MRKAILVTLFSCMVANTFFPLVRSAGEVFAAFQPADETSPLRALCGAAALPSRVLDALVSTNNPLGARYASSSKDDLPSPAAPVAVTLPDIKTCFSGILKLVQKTPAPASANTPALRALSPPGGLPAEPMPPGGPGAVSFFLLIFLVALSLSNLPPESALRAFCPRIPNRT